MYEDFMIDVSIAYTLEIYNILCAKGEGGVITFGLFFTCLTSLSSSPAKPSSSSLK